MAQGFSGSAVVDRRTDHVVGIVVSEFTDEMAATAWMIPVDTLLTYLPKVADWVDGAPAIDRSFIDRFQPRPTDVAIVRQIDGFVRSANPIEILLTENSSESAQLAYAVVLAGREGRRGDIATADDSHGGSPPVGSIDLAIDAAGRTVEQICRRIAERAGISGTETFAPRALLRHELPPMIVVVDGVDDATDPEALLTEVLVPLAERTGQDGTRLLLVFRRATSPTLQIAQSAASKISEASNSAGDGMAIERIEALADRLADVRSAERATWELHSRVVTRVRSVPDPPKHATALRVRLSVLRAQARSRDPDARPDLAAHITAWEEEAERAIAGFTRLRERLRGLLDHRDELRGRLDAYLAMAAGGGHAEDVALAARYRRAHDLLYDGRCDLAAAAEAVERYARAVRDRHRPA